MSIERVRVRVRGAVQGVGFRPYVYRLAQDLALAGTVRNDRRGVLLDLQGAAANVESMLDRLLREQPPLAVIHSVETERLEPDDRRQLTIERSATDGVRTAVMLPDAATCPRCLAEIFDPENRRYGYPFTNCTDCGPRFSIIEGLPYDRPNTTMRSFVMCPCCEREYNDPTDRRFHAQPNACPDCGPRLRLVGAGDAHELSTAAAIDEAAAALRRGEILAAKGLGGFHLMVDATNASAIIRLRERKARPAKPFALMAATLEQIRTLCELDASESQLLSSPRSPILLLRRRPGATIDDSVAPGNPWLGVMLPYTPLHHLLLAALGGPVVATSGNLSDEPICIENNEALDRLGGIADAFLLHDRPIRRHVDDSVVRLSHGVPRPLRRARGLAPLPVWLPRRAPSVLAVGGQLKNTIALNVGAAAFISQHIGDLSTPQALEAFRTVIADFITLYEATPVAIAHDLHPDYASTRWAEQAQGADTTRPHDDGERCPGLDQIPRIPVQHHHAHLAACLAEHQHEGTALGVTWDGTGFGSDGTLWGGEFLLGDAGACTRVASLRRFHLPGGDAAIERPSLVGAALLWELLGPDALDRGDLPPIAALSAPERRIVERMLATGLRAPWTTSAGRLFDGVAALLGLHDRVSFEGQAAMALEFVAQRASADPYPLPLRSAADPTLPAQLDWRPMLAAILDDLRRGRAPTVIAGRFHDTLARAITNVARQVGTSPVALSGGCFQNGLLAERTAAALETAGFAVLQHHEVPANDGGISLGQIAVAHARLRAGSPGPHGGGSHETA